MITVLRTAGECASIADEWNALVAEQGSVPSGPGPTCTFEFCMQSWQTHVAGSDLAVVVLRSGDSVKGILPCYLAKRTSALFSWTELGLLPDLYPGRGGLISSEKEQSETAEQILEYLFSPAMQWDLMLAKLVRDSEFSRCVEHRIRNQALRVDEIESVETPYIEFPGSWDELAQTFSSKFRYNIRSREKKLTKSGSVTLQRYNKSDDFEVYWNQVMEIERGSWKEKAGTSISKSRVQLEFHSNVLPLCANRDWFRGYVLLLDDAPIAHIIGLQVSETFYCLKSSIVDSFRQFSPGVTLKAKVMRELIDAGVRYWDFVGLAQAHKLQWTSTTYAQSKLAVYRPTLRGSAVGLRHKLSKLIGDRKRAPSADS